MNEATEIQILLCFDLGILLQAILLLRNKLTPEKVGMMLPIVPFLGVILLLRLLGGAQENVFPQFMLFCSILFTGFFALIFRKEILPRINEKTMLVFTIVFWYVYATSVQNPSGFITLLALIPSALVFLIVFIDVKLGSFWKFFLYVWYLVVMVSIISWTTGIFSEGNIYAKDSPYGFLTNADTTAAGYADIVLKGMVFMLFVANIIPLYLLYPFQKFWTSEIRDQNYAEYIKFLISKYSDYELDPLYSLLIMIILGGFLIANHSLGIIPRSLAISISILFLSQLISMLISGETKNQEDL